MAMLILDCHTRKPDICTTLSGPINRLSVSVLCCNSTLPEERDDHLRAVAAPGRRAEAVPGSALRAPPGTASTLQGAIPTTPLDVTAASRLLGKVTPKLSWCGSGRFGTFHLINSSLLTRIRLILA
jgi:hypothetical protein